MALVLGQAIAIEQASTDLNFQRVVAVAFTAIALLLIACNYVAPTRDYGSREF